MKKQQNQKVRLRKPLLVAAGLLSLTAGIIGIFVPMWPTTCFLLGAAACFSKSSDRLHNWMLSNRTFGRYLREYKETGTVESRIKVASMSLMWASLVLSSLIVQPPIWVVSLLFLVGTAVTVHVVSIPSRRNLPRKLEA